MSRTLAAVRGIICAAHRDEHGLLHGHTWQVLAWWPAGLRAEFMFDRLRNCLANYDHDVLPDELALGECLAEDIGSRLSNCVAVDVWRDAEGIYARWEA